MSELGDPSNALLKVLLVEDDDQHAFIVTRAFGKHLPQAVIDRGRNAEEAQALLAARTFDILLLDHTLPGMTGLELLHTLPDRGVDIPVIMFTSSGDRELAVNALRAGAYDYVVKTADSLFYIPIIAQRAVEKHGIEREHRLLKAQLIEAQSETERNCRQISEQNVRLRETQKELSSAYDKLLEMNRLKSVFMANMSHELRTPLNAIIGYTSLLLDRIYGVISPRQEECLQRMNRRANELLHQINGILDFAKFEANRMPLFIENFLVSEVVAEAEDTVRPLLKDVQFKFETRIVDAPQMRSDRHKVRQILVNLLSNAFKFTKQGQVSLEVSHHAPEGTIEFVIRDSGIGIRESDLTQIFEEFHQVDGSSTRRFGGTGLGLSIVKKMLDLLGGRVHVTSQFGQGSCFQVFVPQMVGSASEALGVSSLFGASEEPRVPSPTTSVPKLVLAIDDDEDVLKIIEESLVPDGYSVLGAATAQEGFELAVTRNPAVIMLDIALPDRSGWDLLREFKQHPVTRATPVLVMSVIDNRALGFSLGAADYLIKPVPQAKWLDAVRRVLA